MSAHAGEHVYAQKCLNCCHEFCTAGMLPCPLCRLSEWLVLLPRRRGVKP